MRWLTGPGLSASPTRAPHKGFISRRASTWSCREQNIASGTLNEREGEHLVAAILSRAVRSELQLLSQAFFDDTCEVSVEHHLLSAGWLTRIQTVFCNALALCQAAHLSNLKAFDKKIADLCLTQPDASLGLCTVNTQELLSADRKLWAPISDPLGQQCSLDDALYELTHRFS